MKFIYDKENEELTISQSSRIEYHQLDLWLTRHVKGYKYMPAFKLGVWNGKQSYFRNGKVNLGLWRECFNACKEIDTNFVIENKEDFPINREVTLESVKEFCENFFKNHKIKVNNEWIPFMPYDHQIETAYKILKNRYCMTEVATSGGKSLIISIVTFYILKKIKPDAKFLIVVPSITLVNQFFDDMIEYNWGKNNIENKSIEDLEIENNDPWDPCYVRAEEIMSERPRKYTGVKGANIFIGTYQSLEKWPKSFFQQFYMVVTDECHGAKSASYLKILSRTFKSAAYRFGVSGTLPPEDSCEILTLQSVLGPKITEVTANQLKEKGIITPMEIKVVVMNHNDSEFNDRIKQIRKFGLGKEALELEKNYIHLSEKRLDLVKKIVEKCNENSLLLFYTIDYGKMLLEKLSKELPDKEFYYIDGEVSGKKRNEIKKEMEKTKEKVEYTILNFGDYEVDVKSDFQILLSNGTYKKASDITTEDDIDDNFLKSLRVKR